LGLDIRFPLGLIFVITGVILVVYGALTMNSPIYAVSFGININLIWGSVMFVFGAVVMFLGRKC